MLRFLSIKLPLPFRPNCQDQDKDPQNCHFIMSSVRVSVSKFAAKSWSCAPRVLIVTRMSRGLLHLDPRVLLAIQCGVAGYIYIYIFFFCRVFVSCLALSRFLNHVSCRGVLSECRVFLAKLVCHILMLVTAFGLMPHQALSIGSLGISTNCRPHVLVVIGSDCYGPCPVSRLRRRWVDFCRATF